MKLSFFTNCFGKQTWDEICRMAADADLQYIEVAAGAYNGKFHCNPAGLLKYDDDFKLFVKTLKNYHLQISEVSCFGNCLHPNNNVSGQMQNDLFAAMELAARLGVENVNTFAGCPGATENDSYPNWIGMPYPPELQSIVDWQWENKIIPFWKQMVIRARKLNLKFGFKMHAGDAIYNVKTFMKLRDALGAEEICCKFDGTHIIWQGMDVCACIKALGKSIISMHAQECDINHDIVAVNGFMNNVDYFNIEERPWNFRIIGYGHSEEYWKKVFSTLRMIGYDGFIAIEHIDNFIPIQEGLMKAVEFLKRVIFESPRPKEPKG